MQMRFVLTPLCETGKIQVIENYFVLSIKSPEAFLPKFKVFKVPPKFKGVIKVQSNVISWKKVYVLKWKEIFLSYDMIILEIEPDKNAVYLFLFFFAMSFY